jgi:hypothetical protein
MAGWCDLPPHTAAPPDGGYRGALARHVRHVRPVGDDGIFLLFHDRLGCVISSTSTSSQVTRMEPQPEPRSRPRRYLRPCRQVAGYPNYERFPQLATTPSFPPLAFSLHFLAFPRGA